MNYFKILSFDFLEIPYNQLNMQDVCKIFTFALTEMRALVWKWGVIFKFDVLKHLIEW